MARVRCNRCGQFTSDGAHACVTASAPATISARPISLAPQAVQKAAPYASLATMAERLPRAEQPAAESVATPVVAPVSIKNPAALASQLEQAMSPAGSDDDLRTRTALRQIFEQRFGEIDWQDRVAVAQ